jgi:signal transduction histidine kinase
MGVDGYVVVSELPSAAGRVEVDPVASVVSHDLRNPLDVANAHLRAAHETGDDEHFEEVRAAHDRMERIIRDVLTLARGEHALNVADDVDPGAVATDAWSAVDTGAASLTVADDLPAVEADPDRLQRLFENLFRNAVEHARPEPGQAGPTADGARDRSLQVRVGRTDEGWFVADDGVGIPGDERERVFEAGYSTGESGSGTGLGLTIVERIAEAHGWTVSLTAGPLGGARFEFRSVAARD